MTLTSNRGQPPGEALSGFDKIAISEFGDGLVAPAVGQRAGFTVPWGADLLTWIIWSSLNSGALVEPAAVSVTLRGWHRKYTDAAFVHVTAGSDPAVISPAWQASGASSGWLVVGLEPFDVWEWEIAAISGGGTKLYIAQGLRRK